MNKPTDCQPLHVRKLGGKEFYEPYRGAIRDAMLIRSKQYKTMPVDQIRKQELKSSTQP